MSRVRKRYHENDMINECIWWQMHEFGWVSPVALQRKTHLSFDACVKMIEGLPKATNLKIKNRQIRENLRFMRRNKRN